MESESLQEVRRKSFLALKALAHDNPTIQNRLYNRMFELLNVQGADKELAMALVEVCFQIFFVQYFISIFGLKKLGIVSGSLLFFLNVIFILVYFLTPIFERVLMFFSVILGFKNLRQNQISSL